MYEYPTVALSDSELTSELDVSRCEAYFAEVVSFARSVSRWDSLRENLETLIRIGRNCKTGKPRLFKDFAPYSFEFSAGGLFGGLIFHGPCDGSAPNLSVCLEPIDGWSLHT
jgi:Domain of unknown function (DUF4120)